MKVRRWQVEILWLDNRIAGWLPSRRFFFRRSAERWASFFPREAWRQGHMLFDTRIGRTT